MFKIAYYLNNNFYIKMILALFEPQIPENTGNILRTSACFNIEVHIIMPCGFLFNNKKMKRASMDYLDNVKFKLFNNWENFKEYNKSNRIVLATTKVNKPYYEFVFSSNDVILFGNENNGVPNFIHEEISNKITIPIYSNMRSLNLSVSAGIISSFVTLQLGL